MNIVNEDILVWTISVLFIIPLSMVAFNIWKYILTGKVNALSSKEVRE